MTGFHAAFAARNDTGNSALQSRRPMKKLVIDIETGEYEIAADELRAGNKLRARLPEAQIWMVRIGYASTRSFGGRQVRQELP